MKKLVILMIATAMLAACSTDEPSEPSKSGNTSSTEHNSTEVEDGLKEGTTEYDYVALQADEVPVNAKVKFVGTVSATQEGLFELTSGADHSADEIVQIDDIRLGERTALEVGTAVTVYGSYNGKNEEDVPVIKGIFIDIEG